jgi:hypothetical protein
MSNMPQSSNVVFNAANLPGWLKVVNKTTGQNHYRFQSSTQMVTIKK